MYRKEKQQEAQVEKSEFNMALATAETIRQMLTAAALYSQQRELHKWYDSLLVLMREIEYLFDKEETKINNEYQKKINKIDQDYELYRSKGKSLKFKKFGYLYELLRYYEKFLRKALNRREMLLAVKDDPRRAIRS